MCRLYSLPLYDLDLWSQSQNYILTMNLSLARSSLLFDIGIHIPNFGIWVYHHETTCCLHSRPLYDLNLWPVCGWWGILSEFYSQFLSFGMICLFSKCNKNSTTWLRFLYITFYLCCKCATFLWFHSLRSKNFHSSFETKRCFGKIIILDDRRNDKVFFDEISCSYLAWGIEIRKCARSATLMLSLNLQWEKNIKIFPYIIR